MGDPTALTADTWGFPDDGKWDVKWEALQKMVAKAIQQRGYRQGWNDGQFAARQVAKVQEELGERQREMLLREQLKQIQK